MFLFLNIIPIVILYAHKEAFFLFLIFVVVIDRIEMHANFDLFAFIRNHTVIDRLINTYLLCHLAILFSVFHRKCEAWFFILILNLITDGEFRMNFQKTCCTNSIKLISTE